VMKASVRPGKRARRCRIVAFSEMTSSFSSDTADGSPCTLARSACKGARCARPSCPRGRGVTFTASTARFRATAVDPSSRPARLPTFPSCLHLAPSAFPRRPRGSPWTTRRSDSDALAAVLLSSASTPGAAASSLDQDAHGARHARPARSPGAAASPHGASSGDDAAFDLALQLRRADLAHELPVPEDAGDVREVDELLCAERIVGRRRLVGARGAGAGGKGTRH
jgi:hypothetical protein